MAGIYIHIPFCRHKCHYCNFFMSVSTTFTNEVVNAIITEIRLTRNFFDNEPLKSIYFGGGTPSLIENASVAKILTEIQKYHSVDKNAEITLEANPDDLTPEKLRNYRNIGINRLSIGIQSFFDDDLKALTGCMMPANPDKALSGLKKQDSLIILLI